MQRAQASELTGSEMTSRSARSPYIYPLDCGPLRENAFAVAGVFYELIPGSMCISDHDDAMVRIAVEMKSSEIL